MDGILIRATNNGWFYLCAFLFGLGTRERLGLEKSVLLGLLDGIGWTRLDEVEVGYLYFVFIFSLFLEFCCSFLSEQADFGFYCFLLLLFFGGYEE